MRPRLAGLLSLAALALACEARPASVTASRRPSVLVIVLDQVAEKAVGAYGNTWVHTPHIDRLAAGGTRFGNVYVTTPLCVPSRASLWTSRLPHETGLVSNEPRLGLTSDLPTLGLAFSQAGYEAVHFGKEHDGGTLRGFRREPSGHAEVEEKAPWPAGEGTSSDRHTTERASVFLRGAHERPFIAIADLVNPHDICGWVGLNQGKGPQDAQAEDDLPPLPENFEILDLAKRPLPIRYLCCSHRRLAQASRWTPTAYRHYLAAYRHYLEQADAEVGRLLDALDASPAARETIVVLLSDHGDGLAAHRHVTKHAAFYEEAVRVPLIVAGPGLPRGRLVNGPLVSTLDLFPTLCDLARVPIPSGLRGRSLAGFLRGTTPGDSREYVVSQWHSEYGELVTPGRMLRTRRYKYTRYLEGGGEELFDLVADPGEQRTLVWDPVHAEALRAHRDLLARELALTGDPFLKLELKVDPRWRAHALGYGNHSGPSSLDEGRAGR